MIHGFGEGVKVITSRLIPEWEDVLFLDWEDRLQAMTAHHVCLDLLPLNRKEKVIYEMDGALAMHPNTFECLKESLIEKSPTLL